MKRIASAVLAGALTAGISFIGFRPVAALAADDGRQTSAGINPVTSPADREEIFEFTQKPAVTKQGDKVLISFASKGKCDATVAIVDGQGKIVRHLASGVLGPNAPWPFQQGSLSQSIEWDGKDDAGRPAPAGCKARVSLGLKANYGGAIGFDPYNISSYALACDKEGNAYVLEDVQSVFSVIRVFSREGKYLRTIRPMRGGMDAKDYASEFEVVGPADNPLYLPKESEQFKVARGSGMAVSDREALAFASMGYRVKKFLYALNTDGTGGRLGSQLGPWQQVLGQSRLAFAADGKALYVSGNLKVDNKTPYPCVFRFGLDDPAPKEWNRHDWAGKAPVFLGDLDKSGDDNAHFNAPRGVATDKDGNVCVCDYGNDRIQVFSPDARHLRTIKFDRPDQIAVHRKTGDLYVLNTDLKGTRAGPTSSRITKLSPDGRKLAVFEFQGGCTGRDGWCTTFALDDSADPAILWIGNTETIPYGVKGIWRVADKGTSFEKLGSIDQKVSWNPWASWVGYYISVDRDDKWLYMKNNRIGRRGNYARFDATTGLLDEGWKLPAELLGSGMLDEVLSGPDGLLYVRACVSHKDAATPEPLWRIDPDTGKEVPFTAAKDGRIQFPGHFSPKAHRDGFDVAPNGDVYVLWASNTRQRQDVLLHHYGPDGALKRETLVSPTLPYGTCGVRVDRAGSLYIPFNSMPTDKPYPELIWNLPGLDFKGMGNRFISSGKFVIGTLVKFPPEGGRTEKGGAGSGWSILKPVGETARYVGIGPFGGGGCCCRTCRIDLDGFDRVFAPVWHLSCVMVLDANFNRIARLGTWGGPDCQGAKSECPKPDLAFAHPTYVTVSDRSVYTADISNFRILRADLGYHAEQFAPMN